MEGLLPGPRVPRDLQMGVWVVYHLYSDAVQTQEMSFPEKHLMKLYHYPQELFLKTSFIGLNSKASVFLNTYTTATFYVSITYFLF